MDAHRLTLETGWKTVLEAQFNLPYMTGLKTFLSQQQRHGKVIYPPASQWFTAFNRTPFAEVKVVVLGQDPYHGANQAHGLCFSVQPGVKVPPSLANIYKELQADLAVPVADHGCLSHWAAQGVLLLNATLTVEQGCTGSHQGKGWETFTDAAIRALNDGREQLVFMLWGSQAQKKGAFIDTSRHRVLTAPHPSPLSAYRGFLGCRHFSAANDYLVSHGKKPIDWALPKSCVVSAPGSHSPDGVI